ncbi:Lysine-specific demethylase 7B [Anabarilius grahami]|uniref:Lysine-specific demethylase 7B n=1 Tax=Anabarilius grahami TaxID=495550 RepID=A0A3N0YZA7_ANAGA|nr:Lysine-specific demethylase 7B [Anabarilius grahami]
MATAQLYCVCRQPYDVSRFMIECDICKDWFHGRFNVSLLPATNGIKLSSRSPGPGCYLALCTAWFGRQEPLGANYKTPDIHA